MTGREKRVSGKEKDLEVEKNLIHSRNQRKAGDGEGSRR